MQNEKVVLAYSGGLDTSVILKWLEKEKGYDVIAVCIDVGQKEDFDAVEKKAICTGAKKVYILDVRKEFVDEYLLKGLQSGAIYEDDYLLGTAYARPLIAKKLVEIAEQEGAVAIAHGATGKGNDQVRFEAGIIALNPKLKIVAPWRTWDLKSREDCIDYAVKYGIEIPVTKKDIYSRDENLWHVSHEGDILEQTENQHDESMYKMTTPPSQAPDQAEFIKIGYEAGVATSLNGEKMRLMDIIYKLNELGGKHGIGIIDIVENRLVGMKSRGVYETPGGTILYTAQKNIEKLVLDRSTMDFKRTVAQKYAQLVYDGLWFGALKKALDGFISVTQEKVTGEIVMKLYKGSATVVASESPYSLYSEEFVTFGEDEVYNQYDAEGFINLFTLPLKLQALQTLKEKK